MSGEIVRLEWVEQEARHPEFKRLLDLSFDELLQETADELLDVPGGSDEDPTGEWTANGVKLAFAENDHAVETVRILRAKRSVAAVYETDYKGVIGKVTQPLPSWGISVDDSGELFYWSEARHGESAGMFVLGVTDCDALPPYGLATSLMHWYLSLAVYARTYPTEVRELGRSTIPPFDLKAAVGVVAADGYFH